MSALAYPTLLVTVGLALFRPSVARFRIGPATAGLLGMLLLLATRVVGAAELAEAARTLWRPLITVAAILTLAQAAGAAGLLERLAAALDRGGSATALQARVFFATAAVAVVLNNDSAVLVLTPLTVALVRRRWPGRDELIAPFAFAVFLAAGVAPLPVSNPMNLVVATAAGISFNDYAATMAPVWLVCTIASWLLLRRALPLPSLPASEAPPPSRPLDARAIAIGAILAAVLVAYPIASVLGAPLWPVALAGAAGAVALSPRRRALADGPTFGILVFLFCVFVIALGLRRAGVVGALASLYAHAGGFGIGALSALGSALLNNHPMAITNLLALDGAPREQLLCALVGGDLGPRLLPVGSLAGLLWLDSLRRQRAAVSLGTFVRVGALCTLPVLALCLALLLRWGRGGG
jgi:arsenical pump membrane protein